MSSPLELVGGARPGAVDTTPVGELNTCVEARTVDGAIYTDCKLQPQGPFLLGIVFDYPPYTSPGSTYFNVTSATDKDGNVVTVSVVHGASLSAAGHVGADSWFDGMVLTNGTLSVKLSTPTGDANITHFVLLRRSVPGGAFDDVACHDAVPIAGVYRSDATRVAAPGHITFACEDGDAKKCIDWGFPAGSMPIAHQACTRMARDDIRGNGRSHTHLETQIAIRDVYGVFGLPTDAMLATTITSYPPLPGAMFFEAAWAPWGAVCLSRPRWQSLPPGGWPGVSDPRTDPSAHSCEDETIASLTAKGAVLFNASFMNDAPQLRWHSSNGDDYLTTIRGYYSAADGKTLAPFPEYRTYTFDSVDGYLVRVKPLSVSDDEVDAVRLYRERSNNRLVLGLSVDTRLPADLFDPFLDSEGYVFKAWRDGLVALAMFYNPATGDYLSTTNSNVLPAGYVPVGLVGWVPPSETD